MVPRRLEKADMSSETKEYDSLDDYSIGHSSPLPSIYEEIEANTRVYMPTGAHMVSGASQGRLLSQFASMTREGRILELGTFTGYATICFLEGARNVGHITGTFNGNMKSGPYVMSMERDSRALNIAASHVKAVAENGLGEAGAESLCALRENEISEVQEDIVSASLEGVAGCDLLRVTDALATVEDIANGAGNLKPAPFDLVFVDADKTRL
jgi:predicted O-methyltransferase YrrM